MDIRVIFSDLDGTLLNSDSNLSQESLDCIHALEDYNVKFVLASGRHYQDMRKIAESLNLHNFPLISANGAAIYRADGSLKVLHTLAREEVHNILALPTSEKMHTHLYTESSWHVLKGEFNERVWSKSFMISGFRPSPIPQGGLDALIEEGITKIYFTSSEINDLHNMNKVLESSSELANMEIVYGGKHSLEIMAPTISKGRAIVEYCWDQKLYPSRNAVAFGDGGNDVDMLKNAAQGFLMKNAELYVYTMLKDIPSVKIAPTNNEHGVAQSIEMLKKEGWIRKK